MIIVSFVAAQMYEYSYTENPPKLCGRNPGVYLCLLIFSLVLALLLNTSRSFTLLRIICLVSTVSLKEDNIEATCLAKLLARWCWMWLAPLLFLVHLLILLESCYVPIAIAVAVDSAVNSEVAYAVTAIDFSWTPAVTRVSAVAAVPAAIPCFWYSCCYWCPCSCELFSVAVFSYVAGVDAQLWCKVLGTRNSAYMYFLMFSLVFQ